MDSYIFDTISLVTICLLSLLIIIAKSIFRNVASLKMLFHDLINLLYYDLTDPKKPIKTKNIDSLINNIKMIRKMNQEYYFFVDMIIIDYVNPKNINVDKK